MNYKDTWNNACGTCGTFSNAGGGAIDLDTCKRMCEIKNPLWVKDRTKKVLECKAGCVQTVGQYRDTVQGGGGYTPTDTATSAPTDTPTGSGDTGMGMGTKVAIFGGIAAVIAIGAYFVFKK